MKIYFLIVVLLLAGSAQAATLTVCPSGCEYSSIQAAIDAANPGDIVEVHSGTYEGDVNIEEDSITLRGVDTGGGCPNLDGGVTSNSVPTGCWGTLKGPWMIQSAAGPNATVIGKGLQDVKLSEGKVLENIHNASEIASLIQIALNEKDDYARREAIEAIIKIRDNKVIDSLIKIALNEKDNSSRRDAIEALIYTYDSKVVDLLIKVALNEKDDYIGSSLFPVGNL